MCRGKAYFTTPYTLGQYLLMDYMSRKTKTDPLRSKGVNYKASTAPFSSDFARLRPEKSPHLLP